MSSLPAAVEARRPWLCTGDPAWCRNPGGSQHDTQNAYKNHGCRSGKGLSEWTRREKRRRYGYTVRPGYIPSIGVTRRLQALGALGHSPAVIAARLDCTEATVVRIRAGRADGSQYGASQRILATFADAVTRVCRDLADQQGGHSRTLGMARKHRWHGFAAWDDIDDPDAEPNTGDPDTEPAPPAGHDAHLVDAVTVARRIPWGSLTEPQQLHIVEALRAQRVELADIAARVGLAPADLTRFVDTAQTRQRRAARAAALTAAMDAAVPGCRDVPWDDLDDTQQENLVAAFRAAGYGPDRTGDHLGVSRRRVRTAEERRRKHINATPLPAWAGAA